MVMSTNVMGNEPNFNIVGSMKPNMFNIVGCEKKEQPSKPLFVPIPDRPYGDGWQWDENQRVWWKWGIAPQQYCPNGVCPK